MSLERHGRIGLLHLANPPVNALGLELRRHVATALDELAADDALRGLVITGSGGNFSGGADIREFGAEAGRTEPLLNALIERIEASDKVVVAAIDGVALGGGFELALGCHLRVATEAARLGLPEVSLGLIPGAGGTQRLPRLVGVDVALDVIVDGRQLSGEEALALGVVDEVDDDVVGEAIRLAELHAGPDAPLRRAEDLTPPELEEADEHFAAARSKATRRMRGLPAPLRAIAAIEYACTRPLAEGLARERELFVECRDSNESRAQRHLFFAERAARRLPEAFAGAKPRPVQRLGVVGYGTMGVGIAACGADAGFDVFVAEPDEQARERGAGRLGKIYESARKRGQLDDADAKARLARIEVGNSLDALANCDLVIEAAVEELDVKQAVFGELDRLCRPDAVLATNTSTLSIDAIAEAVRDPSRVVGMHFFSPAHVMRLLENVRGAASAPDVIATAMHVGRQLGKVAVLVGNCDGFVGNRMYHCYTRQCYLMLEDGARPEQIDRVLRDFGFAMGPFAVGDLAGLDVSWRIRKRRAATRDPNEPYSPIADRICELGRYGQKTKAGWYDYPEGGRNPKPAAAVAEVIDARMAELGRKPREVTDKEIRERCLYALVNEGARIMVEDHAQRTGDIDVIWRYGYGFPVARGGPMHYASEIGHERIHAALEGYAETQGPIMAPSDWLLANK